VTFNNTFSLVFSIKHPFLWVKKVAALFFVLSVRDKKEGGVLRDNSCKFKNNSLFSTHYTEDFSCTTSHIVVIANIMNKMK
jgi:hypothetical protein